MNLRVLACCVLAGLAAPASAHALLDHAKPGAGAVLHAPPASVTLLFSDDLDPESTVAVVDASGHSVAAGRVTVSGNPDRTKPREIYLRRLDRPSDGLHYEQIGLSPRLTRTRGPG